MAAAPQTPAQSIVLAALEKLVYDGDCFRADFSLFSASFAGRLQASEIAETVFR